MEILRKALGLDPAAYRLDERLKEVAFGEWEGLTGDEFRRLSPAAVAAREADMWCYVPPGGESYERLSMRVGEWLASLNRPTLAVAHGGVGRVLRARLFSLEPRQAVAGLFPQDKAFHWRDGSETVI